MDDYQKSVVDEAKQLIANARENATDAEQAFIDAVERRGFLFMTRKDADRLQEIADR